MPEQVVVCELPCHSVAKDAACCSRLVSGLLESLKKKKDKKRKRKKDQKTRSMAAILLLPTLTLSVSMGVFAIRILQFSTLLGWFTPTFLSSRKPDGQQKTNLELYQMNWSHNVKDFYCRCISWNHISTLELWNSALVWKVKIHTTRKMAVNKNQIWRSTRWAGLITSQTSTVVYLLKLNLWSQSPNPCLGLLGLRGEKVATSNLTVNKNQI